MVEIAEVETNEFHAILVLGRLGLSHRPAWKYLSKLVWSANFTKSNNVLSISCNATLPASETWRSWVLEDTTVAPSISATARSG